jgi:2-dehydro-3-deoxygluconokinase
MWEVSEVDVVSIGETMVALINEPRGYIRHAESFKPHIAGAESNTLIGLSRLGHQVSWISALGSDELGELILRALRAEGVDTSQVLRTEYRTGIFFKEILPNSNVSVTYYREGSAASRMTSAGIDFELIRKAKVLYLTGITLAISESAREMLFEIVDRLKNEHVRVVFDPNIRLKLWSAEEARSTILRFLPYVDDLIIGKAESKLLLGHDDPDRAIEDFMNIGCKNVVIKLGKEGAAYCVNGESSRVSNPQNFEEIDPVGAGDAFSSGYISGILNGEPPEESVKDACFLGGYITQFTGDYEGFPSRKQLSVLLKTIDSDETVER